MGRPAKYPLPQPGDYHPVIVELFHIIDRQARHVKPVCAAAGVSQSALFNTRAKYRNQRSMQLKTVEAIANVLGYTVVLKRIED